MADQEKNVTVQSTIRQAIFVVARELSDQSSSASPQKLSCLMASLDCLQSAMRSVEQFFETSASLVPPAPVTST